MEIILKGVVRYDGTDFSGWQVQPNTRTVQGEIQRALSEIANQPVSIHGAGRTDSGVHALGQVFSCVWPGEHTLDRLRRALCKMLKPDIQVLSLDQMPAEFNARFSAKSKRYRYTIDMRSDRHPMATRYAWHMPYPVDLDRLQALLPLVTGEQDYGGFQSAGAQERLSTVRNVYSITLEQGGIVTPYGADTLWSLNFHGNGFLYKMVRNMTGTLIETARGRFDDDMVEKCLASGGPFVGHCAPAQGLAMVEVEY